MKIILKNKYVIILLIWTFLCCSLIAGSSFTMDSARKTADRAVAAIKADDVKTLIGCIEPEAAAIYKSISSKMTVYDLGFSSCPENSTVFVTDIKDDAEDEDIKYAEYMVIFKDKSSDEEQIYSNQLTLIKIKDKWYIQG